MLIGLLQNAAILVALSSLYGIIGRLRPRLGRWADGATGVLFGVVAIIGMILHVPYGPGVIYDGRSIVLTMAGLFGGGLATAVAIVLAGAYRAYLGGAGIWGGVATVIACGLVGLAFRRGCGNRPERLGIPMLYVVGVSTHMAMLACQLLILPWPAGVTAIGRIWLPVMLVFPAATALAGFLIGNEEERLRTEQALQESEQRFAKAFRAAPILLSITRVEDGLILDVNDTYCQVTGYGREEMVGKKTTEVPLWADPRDRQAMVTRLQREGRIRGLPVEIRTKSGEIRQVLFSAEPVVMESTDCLVATGVDISERLRAEQKLRELMADLELRVAERTRELAQANQALQEFVYSVSHDLRAPLRAVRGFAEIISRRYRKDLNDEADHYFANILQAAGNMEDLINDLLDYSRLGRESLEYGPVPLTPLINEIVSQARSSGAADGAAITVAADLPTVHGTPVLLRQIVENLVGNALKFRRPDVEHRVAINAGGGDSRCWIEVADNGPGIPPQHREKIFNIFQRLHSQDQYPGTGVGLALVRKAAALIGATVTVESTPGQGSVFRVTFAPAPDPGPAATGGDQQSHYEVA